MFWPCETRTSICRNLATISSGLYRFLAITVLLDVKDIPQVGPLQWGWIRATPTGSQRQSQECCESPKVLDVFRYSFLLLAQAVLDRSQMYGADNLERWVFPHSRW